MTNIEKSESVGIVEDMANRAVEWKRGLLVPDYVEYFIPVPATESFYPAPIETPIEVKTLNSIMKQRSQEVSEAMMPSWTSPPGSSDEFVLTDSRKNTVEDDFWDSPMPVGQTISMGGVLRTIVDYNPNTSVVTVADEPNLDKTPPEMLELNQLTPAPTPNIRHRKMQLD